MTQEEVNEGNKLIAEFMGVKIGIDKFSYRVGVQEPLKEEHLAYNTSWNWIMPVVEKIEGLSTFYSVEIFDNVCLIQDIEVGGMAMSEGKTKIEATYKAVIEFIKWYNQQKS